MQHHTSPVTPARTTTSWKQRQQENRIAAFRKSEEIKQQLRNKFDPNYISFPDDLHMDDDDAENFLKFIREGKGKDRNEVQNYIKQLMQDEYGTYDHDALVRQINAKPKTPNLKPTINQRSTSSSYRTPTDIPLALSKQYYDPHAQTTYKRLTQLAYPESVKSATDRQEYAEKTVINDLIKEHPALQDLLSDSQTTINPAYIAIVAKRQLDKSGGFHNWRDGHGRNEETGKKAAEELRQYFVEDTLLDRMKAYEDYIRQAHTVASKDGLPVTPGELEGTTSEFDQRLLAYEVRRIAKVIAENERIQRATVLKNATRPVNVGRIVDEIIMPESKKLRPELKAHLLHAMTFEPPRDTVYLPGRSGMEMIGTADPLQQSVHRIQGKGLGAPRTPHRYVPFGKFYVNHAKLGRGILMLRRPGGGSIPSYKTSKISLHVADCIDDLIRKQVPNFSNLSDEEKIFLRKLASTAELDERLKIPVPDKDPIQRAEDTFSVLVGEMRAGNDNPELIKKTKDAILKLKEAGDVSNELADDILADITNMGY